MARGKSRGRLARDQKKRFQKWSLPADEFQGIAETPEGVRIKGINEENFHLSAPLRLMASQKVEKPTFPSFPRMRESRNFKLL